MYGTVRERGRPSRHPVGYGRGNDARGAGGRVRRWPTCDRGGRRLPRSSHREEGGGAGSGGGGSWTDVAPLPPSPVHDIETARAHLSDHETKHKANQDPVTRKSLEAKRDELRARRTLSENSASLLQRRRDLDTLSRLAACRSACKTTAISRKNTELRKQHVTKQFEERFFAEVAEFDLSYLHFKVQDKSEHAESFVSIGLETVTRVKNRDVLSDGEFRALALACFLTVSTAVAGHHGIVVDDPVSSLDHLRTRVVAGRLVREAATRQVIVFTHDLLFYHELYEAAAEHGVPVVRHWIRRGEEQASGPSRRMRSRGRRRRSPSDSTP